MAYSKPYEAQEGDVSIFINDKEGNEKRPDFTGYALIGPDLKKLDVSLWIKESGKLRFSGKIKEPYNGGSQSSPHDKFSVTESQVNSEDDLPF